VLKFSKIPPDGWPDGGCPTLFHVAATEAEAEEEQCLTHWFTLFFVFFVKEVEIFKDFTRWIASWWLSQSLLCCSN
jgi:hypothetical protein